MSAMQVLVQEKTVHYQQCSYFEGSASSFLLIVIFPPEAEPLLIFRRFEPENDL